MNFLKQTPFFLVLIISGFFLSSCEEDNRFKIDYTLAEDHIYDISAADSSVTRESGLTIYFIEEGSGIFEVERRDQVRVFYTGRKWVTGEIFDSSFKNGVTTPVTFNNIGGLVEGFKEGLIGMKEGEKRVLIIPPDLGYGDSNNRNLRDDTLRFDIELAEILL
ncbi:MAG: FKBP-type peptidyl-prolyl cis-trans isomerase [Balneolaceae bacterium]